MSNGMSNITQVIVLMLENRSFDNLVGWLYGPGNQPGNIIGPAGPYDGLTANSFWNPSNESYFSQGEPPVKVYATEGTTGPSPFTVPSPDTQDSFEDINFQNFGSTSPSEGQQATMLGFLVNYQGVNPQNAGSIMETYSPSQVSMLCGLAANYAISDAWFSSVPGQTWSNRAFVHAGTSNGQVINFPFDPFDYDVPTIYNVLEACGQSWGVYNPGILPSLTRLQHPQLWSFDLDSHFQSFDAFLEQAQDGTLPSYSFVEPSFLFDPNDQHPPYDVCAGEQLLQTIWSSVVQGRRWESTLLIITYDENGGCFDHTPTPWGATPPDQVSNQEYGFTFNRFGARVPAVVVSPWIESGTVFRSSTGTPYDHTSILATLRDWLAIPPAQMLTSQRIANAPTLAGVLNASTARGDIPVISPACTPSAANLAADAPLNELQHSMVVAVARMAASRGGKLFSDTDLAKVLNTVRVQSHAASFLSKLRL